jgi:hypothetical protein
MSRLVVFIAYFAKIAFSQQPGTAVPVGKGSVFVCRPYGFSVETPGGWRVATDKDSGLPLFVNFPWSRLHGQGVLPEGGATIHIVAAVRLSERHKKYSLDEWAEFDELRAIPGTVTSRVLDLPAATGVSHALLVSFDEIVLARSREQRQRDVGVYWEFRGQRFATYLVHALGGRNARQHEDIVTNLMRSLRPLSLKEAKYGAGKKRDSLLSRSWPAAGHGEPVKVR